LIGDIVKDRAQGGAKPLIKLSQIIMDGRITFVDSVTIYHKIKIIMDGRI
jgi:hypothetical protein